MDTLEHHHLGSPIGNRRIKEEILENKYSHAYEHAIDAMVQIDYATKVSEPELGIKITKEGLLMGEVINEVENNWLITGLGYRLKYFMLFLLVWITAIAGALIVIINAWKLIYPIFQPLLAQMASLCS